MKTIRSLAKHLPHPLLYRLYHHTRLREEAGRAEKAAALAGLPLLQTLELRDSEDERYAVHTWQRIVY